jgi:hypothetical protein
VSGLSLVQSDQCTRIEVQGQKVNVEWSRSNVHGQEVTREGQGHKVKVRRSKSRVWSRFRAARVCRSSRSIGQGRVVKVERSFVKVKVIRSRSKSQSHVSGVGFEQRGRVKVQGQKVKVKVVFRGQEVKVDWSRSRGRVRWSGRRFWSVSIVFDVFLRVFAHFSVDFRAVSSGVRASGLGSGPGPPRQPQQRLRTREVLRSSKSTSTPI